MKRMLAFMVAAIMVFAVAGCGGGGGTQPTGTPVASEQPSAPASQTPETGTPATDNNTGTGGVLNIYTWEGYFPQDVLDEFEAETGIKVQFSPFNTNEEMLMKLEQDGVSTYDIVLASDYIIDIARKQDLLAKLDKDVITNYDNLNPVFLSQYYDENNEYTVPYGPGSPLIIYDPDVVDIEITGYEDLWNEALADSIVIMDDARVVLGITLKTMGKSFNETDEAVLEEAKEKLFKLRPNIRTFNYDTPYDDILTGEASVGFMFTSQLNTVLMEDDHYEVVYPKEGLGFGIDCIFVPAKAPNMDNAMTFINFILEPERAARISEAVLYMNPNKASEEYYEIPEALKKVLQIPDENLEDAEMIQDVGDANTKYQEIWEEFKQQ